MEHPGSELGFCGRQEQLKPLKPFIENMVTSQSLWTNEGRIKVLNFPSGLTGGSCSQQEEGKINLGVGIKIWGVGGSKQHKLWLKIEFLGWKCSGEAGEAWSQGKVPAGSRWIKSSLLGQKTWPKKKKKGLKSTFSAAFRIPCKGENRDPHSWCCQGDKTSRKSLYW